MIVAIIAMARRLASRDVSWRLVTLTWIICVSLVGPTKAVDQRQVLRGGDELTLAFSTFLGGRDGDVGRAVAVDGCGNIYITGTTSSVDFPASPTNNGDLSRRGGGVDVFIAKINPAESRHIFTAFLGGGDADYVNAIAVDATGNIYVTGITYSNDFPATQTIGPIGSQGSAFVAKIDPTGTELLYSARFGGTHVSSGLDVAVDASGNAFVVGVTKSDDFPVREAIFPSPRYFDDLNEETDAFLVKLSTDGSQFVYASYLGGSGNEAGYGVAVDANGNAYVTGSTTSSDFPKLNSVAPPGPGGAFVTGVNPQGNALVYSIVLNGASYGHDVAADASGNAYVTGGAGFAFPTTAEPVPVMRNGYGDAFVSKIAPAGGQPLYSVLIGGFLQDIGSAIAVDASGRATVAGATDSADFPSRQRGGAGDFDNFVVTLSADAKQLEFATTIGGDQQESSGFAEVAMAADSAGNIVLAGFTRSSDFPVLHGVQNSLQGFSDAFITVYSSGRVAPLALSAVRAMNRAGKPLRIALVGSGFQAGAQVFIGGDTTMWPGTREKGCSRMRLRGAGLESKFPVGVPVVIRVVNPDGTEASITFAR